MIWIKPSGVEVKTNDREETIEYCISLGWKEKSEEIIKPVSKKKSSKKKTKG